MTRSAACVGRRLPLYLLLIALGFSGLWTSAWGDPTEPSAADRQVTVAVTSLLKRDHLSKHPLDNEISQRTFKTFLKTLDPWKVYFYQSDIDRLAKYKDELDDMAKKGDVGFAYEVFKVFLQRIDERSGMIAELLAGPIEPAPR